MWTDGHIEVRCLEEIEKSPTEQQILRKPVFVHIFIALLHVAIVIDESNLLFMHYDALKILPWNLGIF